jgi:carbon starvation protein
VNNLKLWLVWGIIAVVGAWSLGVVALNRGETISAIWLVTAAVCTYMIAYRFYSLFIARKVMELNDARLTPARRLNDGLDYVPTNRYVLFGHHFAAIAGAGPLVGPVLAAQMGFLPGTLWLLVGVVIAGAVQDFMILFISMRRDGRSLGEIVRSEMGHIPGIIAMIGIFMIVIILLAVLALVVVKALVGSPWGTFTIAMTLPIAFFMGVYMRFIRPGKVGEISIIGFVLLMLSVIFGDDVAKSSWGVYFDLNGETLAWLLIIYGFVASVLPVWLLLAPRDYLSTFLKIGTILGLAVGIMVSAPDLKMPALTRFIDGSGPVFAGSLFPFLFITIACGAISGFHSLVSSGTTPKLVESESHIRAIGYGSMLMESFVGVMAMIAACVLEPGIYFAMNAPSAVIGTTVTEAAQVISSWGFVVTPEVLQQTAHSISETSILSRTGGAPTLAVGMAQIFSSVLGGEKTMAFWYHFAILFEALFILTTVDAGTRVCRFLIQDMFGAVRPNWGRTASWSSNIAATTIAVGAWGYFLYQGVVDPLGGINTLWPLFGIANQMLAAMALILVVSVLIKMKKERYVWVPLVPMCWLLITTLVAGWQKLFHDDWKIGFLAQAKRFSTAAEQGALLAPAKTVEQMNQIITNNYVNATLCAMFMLVVVAMIVASIKPIRIALASKVPTVRESEVIFAEQKG